MRRRSWLRALLIPRRYRTTAQSMNTTCCASFSRRSGEWQKPFTKHRVPGLNCYPVLTGNFFPQHGTRHGLTAVGPMAIVVIGGHSRSVGKTSVVAGLIAALPELCWTSVKITQYGHGICSADGAPCDCATDDHSWAITEERDRSGESDSSRFLVAGAARSLWVRTRQGML